MKVALIHPHIGYKGGLETRLWNYIQWLRARNHEITLYGYKVDTGVELPEGVHLHAFNFSRVPKPIRMWAFNRGLKKQQITDRFDFSLSLGRTAYQSDVLCPGLHAGFMKAMDKRWWSPIDWQNRWLDDLAFKRSERIWAASEMIRQEILRYHKVNPNKIRVLYPPLDTQKFNPIRLENKAKIKEQFGIETDRKVVLFISSDHKRKGLPILEHVWRAWDRTDVELLVAGFPTHSSTPGIRDLGFVEDSASLHKMADVLVHPALYEPFGQIVSEALACGTPVIVSDRVGAKEILKEPWGRVLPYNQPEQWKQAILDFLDNPPQVPENVIGRNHLSLQDHMEQLTAHLPSSG